MKAILLFAALLVLPATAALAQAPVPPAAHVARQHHRHGNPHKAALRMGKRLGLSADQQARVEPILAQRRQKADAVRENAQLSDAERHQQLKAIHRESRMQLSGVLTRDQIQQLKAMHHGRHASSTPPTGV